MIRSTLSRYCPFLARAKCILRASPVFALFRSSAAFAFTTYFSLSLSLSIPLLSHSYSSRSLPQTVLCSSNSWHFVTSPVGDPRKYDTLDSLPLPTLIQHAARERRTARSSGPVNGYGRCSLEHEDPPQSNNIPLNFCKFAISAAGLLLRGNSRGVLTR